MESPRPVALCKEDYVYLNLMHLGKEELMKKLPEISDFATTYLGIKPWDEPVPVMPTAHYIMGGIPTDNDGRVKRNAEGDIIEGLYAAGECACVSVHGATAWAPTRCSTWWSLVAALASTSPRTLTAWAWVHCRSRTRKQPFAAILSASRPTAPTRRSTASYTKELAEVMMEKCSVNRTEQKPHRLP